MIDKTKQKPKPKNSKVKVSLKIAKTATRVPGRPAKIVNLPNNKKFCVDSIYKSLNGKVTKVTVGKRIAEALAKKQIKLIDKKIVSNNSKGQPTRYYFSNK